MIYLLENNNPNCDKWIFLTNLQINFGLWDCTWESVRYHLCFMQVSVSLSKSILQCCVHLFLVSVLSNQCVEYYFIVLNREAGGIVCDALFKWQLLVSVVILTCTIAKKDIVSETCIFPSLGWILRFRVRIFYLTFATMYWFQHLIQRWIGCCKYCVHTCKYLSIEYFRKSFSLYLLTILYILKL